MLDCVSLYAPDCTCTRATLIHPWPRPCPDPHYQVNAALFLPAPGQGLVYGTKLGRVRLHARGMV